MSDDDGGLFCIAIDSDEEGTAKPRDHQSEEAFQELRATYRVKEQNGEVSHDSRNTLRLHYCNASFSQLHYSYLIERLGRKSSFFSPSPALSRTPNRSNRAPPNHPLTDAHFFLHRIRETAFTPSSSLHLTCLRTLNGSKTDSE